MPERPQRELDRYRARSHALKQERDLQAQKAASSRPGQVYHTMTSLQDRMSRPGYTNNQADINQLKGLRRDWNRNQKYTPQGMQVSGATSPMDAQNAYMGMSRDLRQGNKPAYNKMYPLTGGFMDTMDKGGIWGAIASEILGKGKKSAQKIGGQAAEKGRGFWGDLKQMGSDIFGAVGIGGAVPREEATEEVLKNYSDKTFGPHREDIEEIDQVTEEYEGPWPHEDMPTFPDIYRGPRPHEGLPSLDVYEGRRPHEDMPLLPKEAGQPPLGAVDVTGEWVPPGRKEDIVDDITVEDRMPGSPFFPGILMDLFKKDKVIPGHTTSYVDRIAPIEEEEIVEEVIPPIPFDDSNREAGIASLHGQGPRWGSTNRRYEKEYRDYIMSGGDQIDYDDFERFYEKIYQGKPHALHSWYR